LGCHEAVGVKRDYYYYLQTVFAAALCCLVLFTSLFRFGRLRCLLIVCLREHTPAWFCVKAPSLGALAPAHTAIRWVFNIMTIPRERQKLEALA
jgi:hypothetical protein